MFDFYQVGTGAEREDFPYLISICGELLFEKIKGRIIDLNAGEVICTVDGLTGFNDYDDIWKFSRRSDNKICLSISINREYSDVIFCPTSKECRLEKSTYIRPPKEWEYKGKTLNKSRGVYNGSGNEGSGLTVYYGEGVFVLVNTVTETIVEDLTSSISSFLEDTKEAETIIRGAGVQLTQKHEGTSIAKYEIDSCYKEGPDLVITFKQNSFFYSGVQGQLWLLHYNMDSKELKLIVIPMEGLTEPENTISVKSMLSNGSLLISTSGSYWLQDLFLYSLESGLKTLLSKKDRFKGCQRVHTIPAENEVKLIHHSKTEASLLRYDFHGDLIEKKKLNIPYTKTFTKEDGLTEVKCFQDYYLFNDAKEGAVAVNNTTWDWVKYEIHRIEYLSLRDSGWFTGDYRSKKILGYLVLDQQPDVYGKVLKLLGKKAKLINKSPKAVPEGPQALLDELEKINFFDTYPIKVKEKLLGKVSRNKKTHIIEKLQVAGIILEDTYLDEERLSGMRGSYCYAAERVLYSIPGCDANCVSVETKKGKIGIYFERGANIFKFSNLDQGNFIPEILAFINFVLPIRKMNNVKAYFVEKDDKAAIICTNEKAMKHLKDKYKLDVIEASRELELEKN